MPFADNDGVRIHYEVEGEGPPLVLLHGFGASLEHWRIEGYADELRQDFQLVLIDSRGHGLSDKPHDPAAYVLPLRVADVVAVLDDIGIERAHFLGYSMGGWIGWGIAEYAPERFRSLAIGGFSVRLDPDGEDEYTNWLKRCRENRGVIDLAAGWRHVMKGRWSAEIEAMLSANDLDALIAASPPVMQPVAVLDALETIELPCLLYGGELDEESCRDAAEFASQMPNATVVALPGVGHMEPLWRTDLVLPFVREFLAKVGAGESTSC
jgi:pimeloyl-ACP methyl ester carboxylesterase